MEEQLRSPVSNKEPALPELVNMDCDTRLRNGKLCAWFDSHIESFLGMRVRREHQRRNAESQPWSAMADLYKHTFCEQ